MGGSSLGGQALIRELRQLELISLGQAYALLEFLGARDRSNRTTYRATDNDVVVAREGFRQLEGGLATAAAEPAAPYVEPTTPLPVAPAPDYSRPAAGAAAAGAAAGYAQVASRPTAPPPPPPSYTQPPSASAPPPAAIPPDAGYRDRTSR